MKKLVTLFDTIPSGGRGGWSSEGCSFLNKSQRIVTCTCNHL